MSIKARLTASLVALFGVLVIALAFAAYLLASKDAYAKLDGELQIATGATAMAAGHELNEHPTKADGEDDLKAVLNDVGSSDLSTTQILVREQDRNAVYKSGQQTVDLRAIPSALLKNGATVQGLRIAARHLDVSKFHTSFDIFAGQPIAPALARIRRLRNSLLLLVTLGLALAGLGGYLLATKALRPLQTFAETIESVTSADLSARVELTAHPDEIGRLGSRFNFLLDSIASAFTLQRRFMADASHQIKTPVAVALTACQVVNRDAAAPLADCRESLHVIENQMLQLRRIVQDMFFLSQADTASLTFTKSEMYFDEAITAAVRAARTLATAKRQELTFHTNVTEARCLGDEDLLKQAVLTLLDNAVKFTPEEGTVEVTLNRTADSWLCFVSDSGKGISAPAQARVFERFFREEGSSKHTPGAGLGLAIAQSIAEKHGGHVRLVESRPGRTVFVLEIPAASESAPPAPVAAKDQKNSFAVRI
jgi:signal transduction histidine kinase